MSAIDFPVAAAINETFSAPNGVTYKWQGAYWFAESVAGASIGTVEPGMSAAQIVAIAAAGKVVRFVQDMDIYDTIDFAGMVDVTLWFEGKITLTSHVNGPLFRTGGGNVNEFRARNRSITFGGVMLQAVRYGDVGEVPGELQTFIEFIAETYYVSFDCALWLDGFAVAFEGRLGYIRGITFHDLWMFNLYRYGLFIHSHDTLAECDSVKVLGQIKTHNVNPSWRTIWFCAGPNFGSGGKNGLDLGAAGGIVFSGDHGYLGITLWDVTAATWAGDKITVTTRYPHRKRTGEGFNLDNFGNALWNDNYIAAAGSDGYTLIASRIGNPGAPGTLGTMSQSSNRMLAEQWSPANGGELIYTLPVEFVAGVGGRMLVDGYDPPGYNSAERRSLDLGSATWAAGQTTIVLTVRANVILEPGMTVDVDCPQTLAYTGTWNVVSMPTDTLVVVAMPVDPIVHSANVTGATMAFAAQAVVTRMIDGHTAAVAKSVNPGPVVKRGYYWAPSGITWGYGVSFDAPRKTIIGAGISWRGQRDTAVMVEDGADLELLCNIDDPGQTQFNFPITDAHWEGGYSTLLLPAMPNTTISVGTVIFLQDFDDDDWNVPGTVSAVDASDPTAVVVVFPMAEPFDHAPAHMGTLDIQITPTADGIRFGKRFQGHAYCRIRCHETSRNSIRIESYHHKQIVIEHSHMWDASWSNVGLNAHIFGLPGVPNVKIIRNTIGTADHHRHGEKGIVFQGPHGAIVGVPDDGHQLTLGPPGKEITLTYRNTPIDRYDVQRGTSIENQIDLLCAYLRASRERNFRIITVRKDSPTQVTFIQKAGEAIYTIGVAPTINTTGVMRITPPGTELGGDTGRPTASWAIEGIQDGVNGCIVRDNDCWNNVQGEVQIAPAPRVITDRFINSLTYRGYDNAIGYLVRAWGGGGGGGAGRRGAASSARSGGTGGHGSRMVQRYIDQADLAAALAAGVTVTIGLGGTGAPAVTVDDTSGTDGSPGANTTFGAFLRAIGGRGGFGGGAALVNGITGTLMGVQNAGMIPAGNTSITTHASGALDDHAEPYGGAGGGAGGSLSTGNAEFNPGPGGAGAYADPAMPIPTAVAAAGAAGAVGANSLVKEFAGNAGGGGGAKASGAAGQGGAGGRGSGGGGGGASANTFASGAGGPGGNGQVSITVYFD